jgi:hypothetical protein
MTLRSSSTGSPVAARGLHRCAEDTREFARLCQEGAVLADSTVSEVFQPIERFIGFLKRSLQLGSEFGV